MLLFFSGGQNIEILTYHGGPKSGKLFKSVVGMRQLMTGGEGGKHVQAVRSTILTFLG